MGWLIFLFIAVAFLAYANGANDNFKGVATLFGSHTTNYKKALLWATGTTLAGALCSVLLAEGLVKTFSGKGLVPPEIAASTTFALAVALGAGLTVIIATVIGFPISTTHSLTGALTGAGLVACGAELNFGALGKSFFIPLLASPLIALVLAGGLYPFMKWIRDKLGITKKWVICTVSPAALAGAGNTGVDMAVAVAPEKETAPPAESSESGDTMRVEQYDGEVLGMQCQSVLDTAHFASAGMVSFARGLNDTPKIVALLLVANAVGVHWGLLAVGIAMAIGGLLNARKVAEKMSLKITPMSHGQGFTANVVTGFLVVVASRMGVPVSTTHVSCGSLFGIGASGKSGDMKVISEIILSWVLTLPVGALAAGLA
ncbi:MAG TPA: inorganic phosphate transporter, partial [Armatimonadota bacterium]|nr:inorganic phosphate transporter [Armatimonadota bacterium]